MDITRPWMYGAGGVVLVAAAAITTYALVSDDEPDEVTVTTEGPTDPADGEGDPTTGTEADDVTVPVYYLGEVTYPRGESGDRQTALRLYREWYAADGSSAEEAAAAALERMFSAPTDPDYSSPWNEGVDVLAVELGGDVIDVDLTGPVQDASVGAEGAELAVQQLVHTVQGALAVMDEADATNPVQILVDGEPAGDLWGHVDASAPIARADATGVRAPVWITSPEHGSTVTLPLTVTGVAQVFEATVNWRVLQDGDEVASGFATADEGAPAFGAYEFEVADLDPGDYVLEVFESSAIDGSASHVDSKGFTVE